MTRRMASNRVGVGGAGAAPYQPPAEEVVPPVEPVAIGPAPDVTKDHEPHPETCDGHCEGGPHRDDFERPRADESAPVSPEPVASAVAGEPEPPTVAECVASYRFRSANYSGALVVVEDARKALRAAEDAAEMAHNALVRVTDRLARRIDDKQVEIDGEHWRAVRPRKPRGKPADPAALWSLERVEVAK